MATISLNGKFICAYVAVGSSFLFAYITARGCLVGGCAGIGGSMSVHEGCWRFDLVYSDQYCSCNRSSVYFCESGSLRTLCVLG